LGPVSAGSIFKRREARMTKGFSENVSVHEGTAPDGTETILHFEGNDLIVQKRYDAEPHLQYCEQARQATAGQRWGDGKLVGHIPAAQYGKFLLITDPRERMKAIRLWLQENSKFVMFDKYLKR
jgi:hypothetical protein